MATVIAELLVEIGVKVEDAEKAEKKISGLTDKTEDLGKKSKTTKGGLLKLGKAAAGGLAKGMALGAAAVLAAGAAIFAFVNAQTQAIDATLKLSGALGIGVEELQRLQFAAGQSGLDADKLKGGILKLNTAMLQLKEGSGGPLVDTLGELGLGFKELDGLSQTSQIGLIGERLGEIESQAERSALAARIFGEEAGPAMAGLLAEGQEGLENLANSAENVLTEEQAKRAADFQDAMGRLEQFVTGLAQTVATELAPPITEIIDTVREWVAENREIIDSGIDIFIGLLTDVWNAMVAQIKIVIAIFKPLVKIVFDVAKRIEDATGFFSAYKDVIIALFSPIRTITQLIGKLLKGLEKVGIVSEGTADAFEASMARITESSKQIDDVAETFDNAAQAIRDFSFEQESAQIGIGETELTTLTPEDRAKIQRRIDREQAAKARKASRGKKTGGGTKPKGKEDKKKTDAPEPIPGKTFQEIQDALFRGDPTAFQERVKGLQITTPSTKDIKPTVAIDFFQFNITNNIKSTNPSDAASETARAIRDAFVKRFAQAATTVDTTVKG